MPRIDRANELAELDDLWPVIQKHAINGYFTNEELEAKFRAGEKEHARGWLKMTLEQMEAEIQAELKDMVIYRAMIDARWPTSDGIVPFASNEDPGDEGDEDACGVPA